MVEGDRTTSCVGEYDHLNETNPIELGDGIIIRDLDALAKRVESSNYGTHRLLSAVIRAVRDSDKRQGGKDKLLKGLEDLLETGAR